MKYFGFKPVLKNYSIDFHLLAKFQCSILSVSDFMSQNSIYVNKIGHNSIWSFCKIIITKIFTGFIFNIFWCDFLHYHFDWKMAIKLPNFSKIISSFKSKSSKKTFGFSFFLDFRHFFRPKSSKSCIKTFGFSGSQGPPHPPPRPELLELRPS